MIKNLSVKAVWCTKTVESEFPDKGQKLVSIDSLRKRIRKKGTIIVQQPGSGRPCSAHSAGGPCAQSGWQAKKAPISSWDFAWNCHSLFKCTQDHRDLQLKCLKRSCVHLLSEANRISFSHSLINYLIVCNKPRYYSIINCNLNNK